MPLADMINAFGVGSMSRTASLTLVGVGRATGTTHRRAARRGLRALPPRLLQTDSSHRSQCLLIFQLSQSIRERRLARDCEPYLEVITFAAAFCRRTA